jgi:carboxymethylenebutenolidase
LLALCVVLGACGERGGDADPVGAAADDIAAEHAGDSPTPSGAADNADGLLAVRAEPIAYGELGDELLRGYFAYPEAATEPYPAIIMIHEWWGLNDNIRSMAEKLAAHGYMVLAVDLYGGVVAATPDEARAAMMSLVEDAASGEANIRLAYQFLDEEVGAPRIASLGWCLGGYWALNAALLLPDELDAAVMYYGQVVLDEERLARMNVPLLGLFAGDDRSIRPDSVREFRDILVAQDKDVDIHIYPEVGHAFANPSGRRYDAATAADAWQRTLAFLAAHLRQPASASRSGGGEAAQLISASSATAR